MIRFVGLRRAPETCSVSHAQLTTINAELAEVAEEIPITCSAGLQTCLSAFRHTGSVAIHIRTVEELLGHADVSTTMMYACVLNRGALGVRSPADRL